MKDWSSEADGSVTIYRG